LILFLAYVIIIKESEGMPMEKIILKYRWQVYLMLTGLRLFNVDEKVLVAISIIICGVKLKDAYNRQEKDGTIINGTSLSLNIISLMSSLLNWT
jgi:hypothetical protein